MSTQFITCEGCSLSNYYALVNNRLHLHPKNVRQSFEDLFALGSLVVGLKFEPKVMKDNLSVW